MEHYNRRTQTQVALPYQDSTNAGEQQREPHTGCRVDKGPLINVSILNSKQEIIH
jgi:hypothetical protein